MAQSPCHAVQTEVQEAAKYRKTEESPALKLPRSILKNSQNPCPESCSVDPANLKKDSAEVAEDQREPTCSGPPAMTADDCSLPLSRWTGLAQQTGSRPAVDHFTVSRYSPAELRQRSEALRNETRKAVEDAKNVVFTAGLIHGQVDGPIERNQVENRIRLQETASAVHHWKVELERSNAAITSEIENVQKVTQRIMRSARAVQQIRNIDRDMQKIRNMRSGSDLVHDSVTEEIIKEVALCEEITDLYTRCIDEVKKLLQELKDAKQRMEHCWADKQEAYDIDSSCLGINASSDTLQWRPGSVTFPEGQSAPAELDYNAKESMTFIQAALARSRIFRGYINDIFGRTLEDLNSQAFAVEAALDANIIETDRSCRELERDLTQCLKSLTSTEKVFMKISDAVQKFDAPMKCAQTRLDLRSRRPNAENCRDVPHFGLVDEVKDISNSVSNFKSHVKDAEDAMEKLTKSRQNIEREIIVKRKSLWIDSERCRSVRFFYPSNQKLLGYN